MEFRKASNANMIICRNYAQMLNLEDLMRKKTPPGEDWKDDPELPELLKIAKKMKAVYIRYWETNKEPRIYTQTNNPKDEEIYTKTNITDIARDKGKMPTM